MKIKRREIRAIEVPEEELVRYCPHCIKWDFKNRLTQLQDKNFLLCQSCCRKFGKHEISIESKLKDIIEPSDNPFDSGPTIVGLSNKLRKTPREKELQK